MLDFSTIKKIIIPEGVVKRIENNGQIIWRRELPDEYIKLEYISFNNDKYFDVGIIPDLNTELRCKFRRDSSGNFYMYGVTSSDNSKSVTSYMSTNGNWRFGNKARSVSISTGTIYNATQRKNLLRIGTSINYNYEDQNYFQCLGNFFIGGCNNNGNNVSTSEKFIGVIYNFKIYQDGNLISNLIPAKNSNNIEGFYDNIRDIFLEPLT